MKGSKKSTLVAVFFTFFVDNLGATIVFPLFAPLFLSPQETIIAKEISYEVRVALLSGFLAAFPVAQLLITPLIGEYADHHGRRRVLLITTLANIVGYLLAAWSIVQHWLILLFVSRLVVGAAAGNLSVCLSAIADMSDTKAHKAKYYSWGSALAGVTFVLGPFIGGKLTDHSLSPIFNEAFPMEVGALLAFFNFLFVTFVFVEAKRHKSKGTFTLLQGFQNIQQAFHTPFLRKWYLIFFCYLLSWNILYQFFPAVLIEKFHSDASEIGTVAALLGGFWIVGSLLLSRLLLHHLSHNTILWIASGVFAVLMVLVLFLPTILWLVLTIGIALFFASFSWPVCTAEISHAGEKHTQGRIMAISQSIQSLAMLFAPLVAWPLIIAHINFCFLLGALFSLAYGALLFLKR